MNFVLQATNAQGLGTRLGSRSSLGTMATKYVHKKTNVYESSMDRYVIYQTTLFYGLTKGTAANHFPASQDGYICVSDGLHTEHSDSATNAFTSLFYKWIHLL